VVAVITSVCEKDFGSGQIVIHERVKPFEVRDFAARYFRPEGEAVGVGDEVDLGRKPTF
jgi:hypothetical protein